MGKIIAIANQKGGVAKTTTTINLGASIASKGKRVLILDCDPQGNATSGLGIMKNDLEECIYDVLINGVEPLNVIKSTSMDNLYLIPATIQLAGAEVELVLSERREYKLKEAIAKIVDKFDYILIDCPPSLGLLTINAFTAANTYLIPIQCEYYALEGLSQLLNTIGIIRKSSNSNLELEGVVLTMYDNRTNLSVQVKDEIKAYFGDKLFKTIVPRNIRLAEAPSFGLPICLYDSSSKGAIAYDELAEEVINNG